MGCRDWHAIERCEQQRQSGAQSDSCRDFRLDHDAIIDKSFATSGFDQVVGKENVDPIARKSANR